MPDGLILDRVRALLGASVTLNASVPTEDIEAALVPCEVAAGELATVHALLRAVEEKERVLRKTDISSSMVQRGAFEQAPQYHAPETLRTLHELRTRAYGKLVLLRNQLDGKEKLFRIAQANYGFPEIGVVARLAPVARTLVSADVGDEVELPKGTYNVVAVGHLERYAGNELTTHMEDFRLLDLEHETAAWSARFESVAFELRGHLEVLRALIAGEEPVARPVAEEPVREIQRGDTELLSAHFYTRTTKLQESLMQRSQDGLAVVLGVAGSGKTSVALGRTKMLCDRELEDGEESFFRTESAVGFVLSPQLCTYLERTCHQLALYDMPVHEYHWLRSSLFELRRFDEDGFGREPGPASGPECTMDWLRAADAAVAERIAVRLRDAIATPPEERETARRVTARRTAEQEQALLALWDDVHHGINLIADSLARPEEGARFRLQGLAARIDDVRSRFATRLESAPLWTGANNRDLRQNARNAVRERIVRALRLPVAYSDAVSNGFLARALKESGMHLNVDMALQDTTHRLQTKRLSDADIDILLSLAHVVSLGYRGREDRDPISQLTEPAWWSQVFIDEFQDFTEVQLFLMGAHANPSHRTVTVVGDYRQRLSSGTPINLHAAFPWSPKEEAEPGMLLENKRQTGKLARFSHAYRVRVLLDDVQDMPEFSASGEPPRFIDAKDGDVAQAIHDEVTRLPRHHSVAVICPNEDAARTWERALRDSLGSSFRQTRLSVRGDLLARFYVHFTTALEAKGLEFDSVVVAGLQDFSLDHQESANSCYVAISRPRKNLALIAGKGLDHKWQRLFETVDINRIELAP